MDEARRAEQRKKFKYELEKKDEKFEELNQKLEAMKTVLEQISHKVLGCSLHWLGTRPPPVPPWLGTDMFMSGTLSLNGSCSVDGCSVKNRFFSEFIRVVV
ncbi:hypothetical protein Droror1_Dr00011624 [Drosera rotundifolia]